MHQEIAGQSNENNTIITNNKKSLVNKSHQRQQFEDLERNMQSLAMGNGVGCNLTGTGMAATPIDCPHQSNLQQRRQSSFDLHEGFLPSSPSSSSSSSNSSFEAGMNGIEHHHQQSTTPKRSKAQLKKCLHLDLLSISNNIVNNATFSPTSAERMSGGGGILSPWNHPQFQLRRGQRPSKLFPVHLLPYLYLGNDETAKDRETLDKCGIRYVVNVTSNLPNYFEAANAEKEEENTENGGGQPIAYMRIPVDDNSSHNLAEFFPQAISFIEKARSERAAVLVHCWAGISRSVTVCLAYLMYALHLSLEQAYDRLLKQNGTIAPNFHFMEALTCWERDLCAASFSSAAMGIHLPTQQPKGGAPPPRSPSAFSPINIEAQAAAVP